MIYFKDKGNKEHKVEVYGYDNGKATVCLDDWKVVTLKTYFRNERTWDDHMGNTPSGYYVNLPVYKNERKRIYIHYNGWQ